MNDAHWPPFVAGGIAGTTGAILTCPLEVVKTRLQSSAATHSRKGVGLGHFYDVTVMLREIHRIEGVKGLWRGIGPTLIGVIPSRTTYFGVYNVAKRQFTKLNGGVENSPVYLASAASASISTAVLTNPIWLVKTRMQLQDKNTVNGYKNSLDCVRRVWKEEGIKGMYKGMGATLLGVGESTLQWLLYENLQKWVRDYRKSERARKGHAVTPHIPGIKTTQELLDSFLIAATAKLTAACIAYPHEVIRTRMREIPVDGQTSRYTTLMGTFKSILHLEGPAALYSGLSAHLMRVVPNAAIMFGTYEIVIKLIGARA